MKRRNIFKSSNNYDLPTSSLPSSSSNRTVDGSGRSVHMDAPIVKNWKNASSYTRGSYFWIIGSFVSIVWSYKFMTYRYATTFINCEDDICTLKFIPPNRGKKLTMKIHRNQMISTKHIKVTKDGDLVQERESGPTSKNIDHKSDEYDSYGLIVNQMGKSQKELFQLDEDIRKGKNEIELLYRRNEQEQKSINTDADADRNVNRDVDRNAKDMSMTKQEKEKLEKTFLMNNPKFTNEQKKMFEQIGSSTSETIDAENLISSDPNLMEQFETQKRKFMLDKMKEKNRNQVNQRKRSDVGSEADRRASYANNGGDNRELNQKMKFQEIQEKKREQLKEQLAQNKKEQRTFPRLEELYNYAEYLGDGEYMIIMRKYNVGHRRRRVSALMRSVNSYAEGKRNRLVIRENRNVAWQGIIGIIFGVFSFLLSMLLGQFWEPTPRRGLRSPRVNTMNHTNAVRRRQVTRNNLAMQGPTVVPKHFPSSANRPPPQQSNRPKSYGGYVPGKSTY